MEFNSHVWFASYCICLVVRTTAQAIYCIYSLSALLIVVACYLVIEGKTKNNYYIFRTTYNMADFENWSSFILLSVWLISFSLNFLKICMLQVDSCCSALKMAAL